MLFNSIIEAIGRTPLVKLNKIPGDKSAAIYVKLESMNPCHSVKDRIGAAMIAAAEKDGRLKAGMTIVEPTSGNTGIALAMVAAAKGYKVIFTMPESMTVERRRIMKLLGADFVLTPADKGMKGAIEKAEELSRQKGYFRPDQFANPANPDIHRRTTGPEIVQDLGDIKLDAFVAGVGTGGTVSGAGEVLKKRFSCKVYAVEPADSPVISGGQPASHKIQGIGAGFIPENYNEAIVDEVIQVSNDEAFRTARRLAKEEGILAGISSGANVWAAGQVAAKLGRGKVVVTVVCDTGERYLSTPLTED